MKQMMVSDIFSDDELKKILKLKLMKPILQQVILPNFKEIEKRCGQEMSPEYLAYLGEYIAMSYKKKDFK